MPDAVITHLDAETADPRGTGAFWASVPGATIRFGRSTAPKTVKNRVHLDLWVPDEDQLIARGATRLADHGDFRVFADPDGNEFCAFPPSTPGRLGVHAVCTDSAQPERIAAWWAGIVGGEIGPGPDGTPRYLHGARGLGELIWKFVRVADDRTVRNRWSWEVSGDVDELVAAGAAVGDDRTLVDPDGNEFRVG